MIEILPHAVFFLAVGGTTAVLGYRVGFLGAAVAQWITPVWLMAVLWSAERCGRDVHLDGGLLQVLFLSVATNVLRLPLAIGAVFAGKVRSRHRGGSRD